MTNTITLKNVPPELHKKLKERAASSGVSLQAQLLDELDAIAAFPTEEQMMRKADGRGLRALSGNKTGKKAATARDKGRK